MVHGMKWAISLLLMSSVAFGQDSNSNNASDQTGDLNNNYQGAVVDSNNETNTNTNQYNGSGSAADKIPVSTATAPPLMSTGTDSCLKSSSGGAQVTGFGFSSGSYQQDPECNRRKDSVVLKNLGMNIAAISRMCQNPEVWEAMISSGTPCPLTVNGKIVVGKAAFIVMRRQPKIFVPGYEKKKEYFDIMLGIGENNNNEENNSEDNDGKSISERYRTSKR